MACTSACHDPTPAQAHCAACHRTFANVTTFDEHRRAGWSAGVCPDPAALGLVDEGGVWGRPEYHEALRASRARMADPARRVKAQADVRAPVLVDPTPGGWGGVSGPAVAVPGG